ncbi:MAG: HAMP domain-containing histidine kinase [Acidobacteria bacterium]|nr:HAMP domain-containing histidine kinase [Acidobacteriota bacterium]
MGLRAAVIALGAAWLLLTPHLGDRRQFGVLFSAFLIYTLLIYALILRTRWPVSRIYLSAQLLDLFFLFQLVRWTGGLKSVFALGFYLLVGLHSFYFGRRIGIMIATLAGLALVLSSPRVFQAEPWLDSTVRVGFLYLIAWSIALLANEEKHARRRAEELIAQLQNATRILEQAQKMALVGRLTAGIAHEINNPAAVILTRVERMLLEAEENLYSSALKKDLESLQKHARRVADIVQKMLAYSRSDSSASAAVNINEVIQQSVPLIEHRLAPRHLTLSLDLLQHLPRVYGNANRLEEAFVNLMTNAIDASSPGGQIHIASTISDGQGKEVQVSVSDEGEGIPQENMDKIFEPFFTTKPPGQGTGLGLYITYQILRDHRASISIESQPGKGTTVSIGFPRLEGVLTPPPSGRPLAAPR